MKTTKITGTITEGNDRNLTLRIWVGKRTMEEICLEKGIQPNNLFKVIIMKTPEDLDTYFKKTKGMIKEV